MGDTQTIVLIATDCNQNCIFCSGEQSKGIRQAQSKQQIIQAIKAEKNTLSIEGGEPTLSEDLIEYVTIAKKTCKKDIILVTNGVRLVYKDYCRKLLDAGVTLFNINLPHSKEKKSDAITRSPGHYQMQKQGIKNLIQMGAGKKVRLNFVINKTNYKNMLDYVKMVKQEFPEIFYIEFNYIKILGYVKKRKALVPTLTQIHPYFKKTLDYCKKNKIRIIVDGIPLCYMVGYEQLNIDTEFIVNSRSNPFIQEKYKPEICKKCSLTEICSGIRKDYYETYGSGELKPSKLDPDNIKKKVK